MDTIPMSWNYLIKTEQVWKLLSWSIELFESSFPFIIEVLITGSFDGDGDVAPSYLQLLATTPARLPLYYGPRYITHVSPPVLLRPSIEETPLDPHHHTLPPSPQQQARNTRPSSCQQLASDT
jgi:hypothetical protein